MLLIKSSWVQNLLDKKEKEFISSSLAQACEKMYLWPGVQGKVMVILF